ncbi:MAG: hypothetical protein ACR2RB_15015 [Gammaproteobacteria bacterium]
MKAKLSMLVFGITVACTLAACGGGSSSDSNTQPAPTSPTPTIEPGDTFSLGESETLTISGAYMLPAEAALITTRCTGEVMVTFETVPGSPMTNTCQSSGSSSQTNIISGVTMVMFGLVDDAFARVTVN